MNRIGVAVFMLALLVAGCSDGSTVGVSKVDEGAQLNDALASEDVHETLCPVEGGTYSRGEWAKPDARMRRSASPVILENLTPPQRFRTSPGKPWVTKAPVAVRLDGEPVEIAVLNPGDAEVGLLYDEFPREYAAEAAYERIRFLPCDGDPTEPTWFGWPGSIVADQRDVCLKLAVREGEGAISVQQVSLGDGCPARTDG